MATLQKIYSSLRPRFVHPYSILFSCIVQFQSHSFPLPSVILNHSHFKKKSPIENIANNLLDTSRQNIPSPYIQIYGFCGCIKGCFTSTSRELDIVKEKILFNHEGLEFRRISCGSHSTNGTPTSPILSESSTAIGPHATPHTQNIL